jgi:hypothetical protein
VEVEVLALGDVNNWQVGQPTKRLHTKEAGTLRILCLANSSFVPCKQFMW